MNSFASLTCGRRAVDFRVLFHTLFLLSALPLAIVAVWPLTVHAQPAAASAIERDYDLPAAPLATTLNRIAREAGLALTVDAALVGSRSAAAVRGRMSAEQALRRALSGSGLELVRTDVGSYTLRVPKATVLPDVKVASYAIAPDELPEVYAGGQVARGGRLGNLGNRDMMDTPFTQTAYTEQLMQDQQAHYLSDVLSNDATVVATSSIANGVDGFSMRGFPGSSQDVLFNGLPGVAPSYESSVMLESIERVEIFKGSNAFLNGAAQSGNGIGGAINLMPKRAAEAPLTRFTAMYASDSQLGGHVDLGRRFGEQNEFGMRFNGVYRNGDTAVDHQSQEATLFAFGLDYRGARFKASADFGYQEQDLQGGSGMTSMRGGKVPDAPDSEQNFSGPYGFNRPKTYYGMLRGEYEVSERLTAYAAIGGSQLKTQRYAPAQRIINEQGDLDNDFSYLYAGKRNALSYELGTRGNFTTGSLKHQAVLAYTQSDFTQYLGYGPTIYLPESNIYDPDYGPSPDLSGLPSPDDARKANASTLKGMMLADTVSMLDDTLQLMLGIRVQQIKQTEFNRLTGSTFGTYDENRVTPLLGVVVKPQENVSLYASYIEGLQPGLPSGVLYLHFPEPPKPFISKQHEVGAKVDFGRIATSIALYQIEQPTGTVLYNPQLGEAGVAIGEQRHRGIDLNVFGEATSNVRVLGGLSYIDSEITKSSSIFAPIEGNRGGGVPEHRWVLGGEWDTPFVPGLTLTGRAIYTGSMYVDSFNNQKIPGWTRVDLGVRYHLSKSVVVRANLENAFGEDYWMANNYGALILSSPRTFTSSVSMDF